LTRKRIQKKVRIGVGADPPLVSDLEISLGDVGKQRGEFQGPQFELNAGTAPLLLGSPSVRWDWESVAKRGSRLVGLDSMRKVREEGSRRVA